MKVQVVKNALYDILARGLSTDLTYHSIKHTEDVHRVCMHYADVLSLTKKESNLLEIAAVGHDVGFTKTYVNHEEASAKITAKIMHEHDHTAEDIALVSQIIMATRIPQNPNGLLAEILCDADLDYLGRECDFEKIGKLLLREWSTYNIIPNVEKNFDTIQINFLQNHSYHTAYAKKHREPQKQKHLKQLRQKVSS